jgi:hypothetical protein
MEKKDKGNKSISIDYEMEQHMNFLELTASPIFFAIFESVIFAKGLSAPQHSTYFVILDDGRVLDGIPPGVAVNRKSIKLNQMNDKEHRMG